MRGPTDPAPVPPGDRAPARAGELAALRIGPLQVDPPVVLAPMAGVTTPAFRSLCASFGPGLFVSEMVSARGLVEGGEGSWELLRFGADEHPRSAQVSGADPAVVGTAVGLLVARGLVDHIDLNVGCPVPKVTRHGGGAALAARPALLGAVVEAAVVAAGDAVPVTVKMRLGLDDRRRTHLAAGRACQEAGAAAVALHARTAAQRYSGTADWSAIAELVEALAIPVLGNGDIWEAGDALAMIRTTGCAGVVIGRGCLGRPWLFGQLADACAGRAPRPEPHLGAVLDTMGDHAARLCDELGERRAMREMRRHAPWYLTGHDVSPAAAAQTTRLETLADLDRLASLLDRDQPPRPDAGRTRRGPTNGPTRVAIPHGWLDDGGLPVAPLPAAADLALSGG